MLRPLLTVAASMVLMLTLLAMPGCAQSAEESQATAAAASAAGTWELDRDAIREAMQLEIDQIEDPMEKAGAAMMMGMIDAMSMVIVLRPDGTCTGTMTMMGETDESTGTWAVSGNVITISMLNDDGEMEEMSGPLEGDMFELVDSAEESPMRMVFRRAAS